MSAGESSRVEPPAKRQRQAAAAADDGSGGDGSAWQLGGDATIETIGAGEEFPYPDGKDADGKSLTPAALAALQFTWCLTVRGQCQCTASVRSCKCFLGIRPGAPPPPRPAPPYRAVALDTLRAR